ncbi:MAG TPA: FAD-dependent oxidoreductase, partial [Sulfuricaulis sp.]|nr:FAD-dependent oxidoreductase [Sulfuricaulis sp.]
EHGFAQHASGRNSGVLHAGFYYTADSLKARFTRDGNAELTQYCEAHDIPLNRCGKLVVVQSEAEHPFLDELLRRGRANNVSLDEIDERTAREIEPRAVTCGRAIFSPTTSSVDPVAVVRSMEAEARNESVAIHYGAGYLSRTNDGVRTTAGIFRAGYVVNAAGLYADHVALGFGFSEHYRILPFKGLYLYSKEPPGSIRAHIYPVPDLRHPFLGVHFTVAADGHVKIGPTAIPALWREQYRGLDNFQAAECGEIMLRQMGLLVSSGFDFVRLARQELRKYSRARMVSLAAALARGVHREHYQQWGKPGIRAQLLNTKTRKLEMDFVFEGDRRSFHILNAVSPGFTCCLPFSRYVCDAIGAKLN